MYNENQNGQQDDWLTQGSAQQESEAAQENVQQDDWLTQGSGQQNSGSAQRYYQQSMGSSSAESGKKKGIGKVLLIIGAILLVVGALLFFTGDKLFQKETETPVDIYEADHEDQLCTVTVQYMTYPVAYYEAMETMNFYITMDEEWNCAAVCIHDNEIGKFEPYVEWLFTEEEEGGPQPLTVSGYAQPFEEDLIGFVCEEFENLWGYKMSREEFYQEFGHYYLFVGEKNDFYKTSNTGIFVLLAALVVLVIGLVFVLEKKPTQNAYGTVMIMEEKPFLLGVLGAFLGACLGGLAWAIVNILGYVSGWIGLLIMFLAYSGYKLFSNRKDTYGIIISFVFGIVIIIPATYLAWGWEFYKILNQNLSGFSSLSRALAELPAYMSSNDLWGDFALQLVQGYLFMGILGIYWLVASRKNR